MGHFSMEKSLNPGSALSGNQQTLLGIVMIVASGLYVVRERNAGSGRT